MNKTRLQNIIDDLNERMGGYHSSLEPTNDEVTIAWLLAIINELGEKIDSLEEQLSEQGV